MALTWRAVVLTALGVVPVLLAPATLVVIGWGVLVVVLCALDAALAASPHEVAVSRTVPASVRLTERTQSTLTLTNRSRRRLRALVRDGLKKIVSPVKVSRTQLKAFRTEKLSSFATFAVALGVFGMLA